MSNQDAVTNQFTGTGRSSTYTPYVSDRSTRVGGFNVFLKSTSFIGTVQLERTNDGGTTWFTCGIWSGGSYVQLSKYVFTGSEGNTSETVQEMEPGTGYCLNCTAYTSGTLDSSMEG